MLNQEDMREYSFATIQVGIVESFSRKITKEMEDSFRNLTDDRNPLHKEDAFAEEIGRGKFRGHVVFGMLTAAFYSTLAGMYLPGKYSLIHSFETLSFIQPVYVGDTLHIRGEVIEKEESLRVIRVKASIRNQEGELVSKAKMKILVIR